MTERFQWVCSRGCGNCRVKRIEFEYERTEDMSGNLLASKTTPRLVSACCSASLTMWDNEKDEEIGVDLEPVMVRYESEDELMINGLTAAETSATASVMGIVGSPASIAGSAGDGIRAALEAPGAAGVAVRAPECREVCMVADAGGYPPCGDGKKPCRALGVTEVEVPNCDSCGKAMPGYDMPGPAGELYCAACRGADGVPGTDGGPLGASHVDGKTEP